MSVTQQHDASKSEPLHIEQLKITDDEGCTEGTPTDKDAEKRLLRKLDLRIVPILWLMFMLAFLDRTNVCYVPSKADSVAI